MRKTVIFILFACIVALMSLQSSLANPFGLDDPTVIDAIANTCTTEKNNFEIVTHNCVTMDADGKDIEQEISFSWNGGSNLKADFIFAYEGTLSKGNVYLKQLVEENISSTQLVYQNKTIIITTSNMSIDETNKTANYTLNNTDYNISFLSYTTEGSTYTFIQENNTYNTTTQTIEKTGYVDITEKFSYLGTNLFGQNMIYYGVEDIDFTPGQTYDTKWVYTPSDASKQGKFHIFAKPDSLSINQAVAQDLYIYQDPWWNNTWKYKQEITISSASTDNDVLVEITLNSSNFDYDLADGTDFRILNSSEDGELNFRTYVYNEDGNSTILFLSDLTTGDNTFYLYYNNSLASDNSNESIMPSHTIDDFEDGTLNLSLWTVNVYGGATQSCIIKEESGDLKMKAGGCGGGLDEGVRYVLNATDQYNFKQFPDGSSIQINVTSWAAAENGNTMQIRDNADNNCANVSADSVGLMEFYFYPSEDRVIAYDDGVVVANATNSCSEYNLFLYIREASSGAGQKHLEEVDFTANYNVATYNVSIDAAITQIDFLNELMAPASYLDFSGDGTNYGATSDGFASGLGELYNLTPQSSDRRQVLIIRRTELDGGYDAYVNDNLVGSSPSYASGTGDYIWEAFEVQSSDLVDGINEINITAKTGNGETIYVDYILLADTQADSDDIAAGGSWVVNFVNVSSSDTLDTVQRIIYNSTGGEVQADNETAAITLGNLSSTHLYAYQLPSDKNENYSFGWKVNTTTESSLVASDDDPTIEIDSASPVINSVTLNLDSYVGESEDFIINTTEKNIDYVTVSLNGTWYNFSLNKTGTANTFEYNLTAEYANYNDHTVQFRVVDVVGHDVNYSVTVSVSNISQISGAWNFNTTYNYTRFINITDTFAYHDHIFKVPFTFQATGTAYIDDYNGSYTILDTRPFDISLYLANGTAYSFSNTTTSLSWLTDPLNDTTSHLNNLYYSVDDAIGVEWENSGVGDTRLFYVNRYNMTNNASNITLQVPLRTTYTSSSSSIDIFECTSSLNWGAKTCGQWTEITAQVFSQSSLTWHHWGNDTTDYPTVDSDNDTKKDVLRLSIATLSGERMFKIESDSSNAELEWTETSSGGDSGSGSSGGGGGGGGGGSSGGSTAIPSSTNGTPKESKFLNAITGFFADVGAVGQQAINKILAFDFTDTRNTFLLLIGGVFFVGILVLSASGESDKKKRKAVIRS